MEDTIFYSWQSDHPKSRRYIESALKLAIENLAEDPTLEAAPRIDKDTQDITGAVHIVDTIKKKINDCAIFLADVSLVDTASSGRSIVNQNVMFELGYAIGKHTESHVIMVANSDLGDIKNLPFDISHHRVIQFSPSQDKNGVKLQSALQSAVSMHLKSMAQLKKQAENTSDREKLLEAINQGKSTRSIGDKYFRNLYGQYLEYAPGRYTGGNVQHYGAEVYNAYLSTKKLTLDLYEILQIASEHQKTQVIIQAYKNLSAISQYYDITPADTRQLQPESRDFYALIINEIISLILGCVAQEKLWDVLQDICTIKLNRPSMYGDARTLENLSYYPESTLKYYQELSGHNDHIAITYLVEDRFSENEDILQTYLDGSLLRYFMTSTFPWPVGLMLGSSWSNYVPEFLSEFKKIGFVNALRNIRGEPTLDEFRTNIWQQASRDIGKWRYEHDNLLPSFKYAGIEKAEDIGSKA